MKYMESAVRGVSTLWAPTSVNAFVVMMFMTLVHRVKVVKQ